MSASTGLVLVGALCAAGAVAVLPRARPVLPAGGPTRVGPDPTAGTDEGWLRRHRRIWAALVGLGAWTVLGGVLGAVAGLVAAVVVVRVAASAEPADVRRRRERAARDLPSVVLLLGTALRSGAAPAEALDQVGRALPGPAADRLVPVTARLRLGADPADAWGLLAADPALAPLGQALARAQRSGASVTGVVERLADELAEVDRARTEDLARTVGVRAAVPLGLCLLPAFVLVGIVPLVAALLEGLAW
ncbi:MAG: type II secretion system protein [Nocardioides sp.]|nr:type II secretion system protein [Nocardioides sp.]